MAAGSGTGTSITGVDTTGERKPWFSAVWVFDTSAADFVDNTIEAQLKGGTAFTILEATGDYLYLGSESRFDMAGFYYATSGVVSGLVWEYYKGGTWTRFVPRWEHDFTSSGAEEFDYLNGWTTFTITTTSPHTASTVPDSDARYYIRLSASSITTSPTVKKIECRPYAAYCTPTDVANLLQFENDFDEVTRPLRSFVEDRIHTAQDYIDYRTRKSWRLNYREHEQHQFSIAGFKLEYRDLRTVTKLEIWNGGGYETKTTSAIDGGRDGDYFWLPDEGMIKFARYFIIPARFQSGRGFWGGYGFGEFDWPVRVSYMHGKDIDRDRYGATVFDIACKLAAIDIVNNSDFSVLAVMGVGTDKVSMEQKIENWKKEIEDRLDDMQGWVTF